MRVEYFFAGICAIGLVVTAFTPSYDQKICVQYRDYPSRGKGWFYREDGAWWFKRKDQAAITVEKEWMEITDGCERD